MAADDPYPGPGWPADEPDFATRRARLISLHGIPERIDLGEALTAIGQPEGITPRDVWASIYRDQAAADAWLGSNLAHHGHPTLGRAHLADGRVIGVLDLRPELARSRERVAEMMAGFADGRNGQEPREHPGELYLDGYRDGKQLYEEHGPVRTREGQS